MGFVLQLFSDQYTFQGRKKTPPKKKKTTIFEILPVAFHGIHGIDERENKDVHQAESTCVACGRPHRACTAKTTAKEKVFRIRAKVSTKPKSRITRPGL